MTEEQDPTETLEGAQNGAEGSEEGNEQEPRTYTEEEYNALKEESIKNRLKAKDVDTLREALHAAYLREGSAGILHDATALAWSDDFNGEDGLPDVAKIRAAAEALADEQPWLSRPRGDAGQGFRGSESDSVSLADLLKAGA